MGVAVLADRAATIARACQALRTGGASVRDVICAEYPFVAAATSGRRYTAPQALRVFLRDSFIDRYSGRRLVFPGVLRLLSRLLPQDFPFHPNWKVAETHPSYWELFPTIDHVLPVARGGADSEANWITTSMLRNTAKANWTLAELGWGLREPGSLAEWDGLTRFFLEFVDSDRSLLEDAYLRRWQGAAIREWARA
jgi:hypothetical protein